MWIPLLMRWRKNSDEVFLDTNVIVNLLGKRMPFFEVAAEIMKLAVEKCIQLLISSITFVTTFYLLRKYEPENVVIEKLKKSCSY